MAKDRSYANPVAVTLQFSDRPAPVKVEVSEYQVTDKHVILTRKQGDSKITKYVAISALKTFEFDAPMDYAPKMVLARNAPPYENLEDNGAPVFTPNPIVARNRPVAVRPPAETPVVKEEGKLIEVALTGAGAARMS